MGGVGYLDNIYDNNPNNSNIVNLNEFRRRMNIFITGKNYNYFENLNWNNIVFCGSITSACIPKINPLMLKWCDSVFNIKDNELCRFFKEYYRTSDIDVACNLEDKFEYVDEFFRFYNKIQENIYKIFNNVEK